MLFRSRAPSEAFDALDEEGAPAWPASIDRAALDPHFDTVETMMGVRQATWDEVPKTGAVFAMLFDRMGLTCDRGRFPYEDCRQCGFCEAGCRFDRKKSLLFNYIPAAEEQGAQFRTEADVRTVAPHDGGFRVRYATSAGGAGEVWGRRVIVAANAIETPALLLRSAADLPGLSEHVGLHLNNNGDVAWYWMLPEGRFPEFVHHKGRTNAVMISYAYWAEHRISIHTGCPPPAVISGLDIHREGGLPWGLEHKRLMHSIYRNRMLGALAIGLVPGWGRVRIDGDGNAKAALPMTEGLRAYINRVVGVAKEIGEANGAEVLRTSKDGYEHADAHPLGTCRMGDDPARSVVDPLGQVHGQPGLFITDGSTLPGGTGVNPSLTIAANAERIAAHLATLGAP